MKRKIIMFGVYPPPLGGISNHINRLIDTLESKKKEIMVFDISSEKKEDKRIISLRNPLGLLKGIVVKGDYIHFHESGFQLFYLPFIISHRILGHKMIITYHSFRTKISGKLFKGLLKFQNRSMDKIVVVNEDIKKILLMTDPKLDIIIIPAFIPPKEIEDDVRKIPDWVTAFIKSHSPIICGNASKLKFYNGIDLYGVDLLIDLCERLKKNYSNIGLIFSLSSIGNLEYFKNIKDNIIKKGLQTNFIIVNENVQFYPILMKCDVFIRPTNTDGDSLSVREALHFQVPTVASNVVNRPDGTITFMNRNDEDLYKKTLKILENPNRKSLNIPIFNNANKIMELYN